MKATDVKKGDYVLATKWGDGDPQDHWCIGFFSHMLGDRYVLVDDKGVLFRTEGFRRAKRISTERGKWLLDNVKWIELSGKSMWWWVRQNPLPLL